MKSNDTQTERSIHKKAIRFALTGLFVTAFHTLIAILLIEMSSQSPPLANGMAFLCATILSYVINTTWSFSAKLHGRTLARFISVSIIGLLLAMLVAWSAELSGLNYLSGICAVALTVPLITFLLHNYWTYR